MDVVGEVKQILGAVLNLNGGGASLDLGTRLLGNIPELDSMAVVSVVTAIEERLGVVFDDEEITAEVFETVGTLCGLVERKLEEG